MPRCTWPRPMATPAASTNRLYQFSFRTAARAAPRPFHFGCSAGAVRTQTTPLAQTEEIR